MSDWWETAKVGDVVELPEVPLERPEGTSGKDTCELAPGCYTIRTIASKRKTICNLIYLEPEDRRPNGWYAWRFRPVAKPARWSLPERWGELEVKDDGRDDAIILPGVDCPIVTDSGTATTLNRLLKASEGLVKLARLVCGRDDQGWIPPQYSRIARAALALLDGTEEAKPQTQLERAVEVLRQIQRGDDGNLAIRKRIDNYFAEAEQCKA